MEMFVLSYVNVLCIYPRLFKLVLPNGSEPIWQTSMLYSDIVPLIYVNENICMVICPSQSFYGLGWIISCHSVLRHSFLFINRLLVTIQHPSEDQQGVTLSAPFWCLHQKLSLSPLFFNKTLLHKSSERSSLISGPRLDSSPLEAKNPGLLSFSNNLSAIGGPRSRRETEMGSKHI